MEKGYRLRITRDDVEFEVEGDKKFVVEMLDRFESSEPAIAFTAAASGKPKQTTANNNKKSVSVREFIQRLGFKKHTDIGLAFGYYLEHYSEKASFTPADINNCYYEAKMETSNTSQVIIQNIKSGRIMEAKRAKDEKSSKKAYVLTQTGEQFVSKKIEGTK